MGKKGKKTAAPVVAQTPKPAEETKAPEPKVEQPPKAATPVAPVEEKKVEEVPKPKKAPKPLPAEYIRKAAEVKKVAEKDRAEEVVEGNLDENFVDGFDAFDDYGDEDVVKAPTTKVEEKKVVENKMKKNTTNDFIPIAKFVLEKFNSLTRATQLKTMRPVIGYTQKQDEEAIYGKGGLFDQADKNKDGRLNHVEFCDFQRLFSNYQKKKYIEWYSLDDAQLKQMYNAYNIWGFENGIAIDELKEASKLLGYAKMRLQEIKSKVQQDVAQLTKPTTNAFQSIQRQFASMAHAAMTPQQREAQKQNYQRQMMNLTKQRLAAQQRLTNGVSAQQRKAQDLEMRKELPPLNQVQKDAAHAFWHTQLQAMSDAATPAGQEKKKIGPMTKEQEFAAEDAWLLQMKTMTADQKKYTIGHLGQAKTPAQIAAAEAYRKTLAQQTGKPFSSSTDLSEKRRELQAQYLGRMQELNAKAAERQERRTTNGLGNPAAYAKAPSTTKASSAKAFDLGPVSVKQAQANQKAATVQALITPAAKKQPQAKKAEEPPKEEEKKIEATPAAAATGGKKNKNKKKGKKIDANEND